MDATANSLQASERRRTAIRRSIAVRIIAALILIAFVCFVGDLRRRHNGTSQMKRYAAALNVAIGDSGVIPRNLDPSQWLAEDDQPINMTTLTREQVACLRDREASLMIAWTVRLIQVLGVNGRAIVNYQNGRVEPKWVTESTFEALRRDQALALSSCK